jgi:hypothetical protein
VQAASVGTSKELISIMRNLHDLKNSEMVAEEISRLAKGNGEDIKHDFELEEDDPPFVFFGFLSDHISMSFIVKKVNSVGTALGNKSEKTNGDEQR